MKAKNAFVVHFHSILQWFLIKTFTPQKFLILPPRLAFVISCRLNHLQRKEPNNFLLAKVDMSKLSQELTQIAHNESLHTFDTREKFSHNKFFHNVKHKILD